MVSASCSWFFLTAPTGLIVTLRFSCLFVGLSVCLSVCHSLGRPRNELIGMYSCFELAGLFAYPPQNDASTIDSRGTALVTQAQYRESSPRSMGMARNRQLTSNKPRSEIALVLQYSLSCKRASSMIQ